MSSRWLSTIALGGIFLTFVLALLAGANPFVFDDIYHFLKADYLFKLPDFGQRAYLNTWFYRPITSFTYLLEGVALGFNSYEMRLFNSFIHLINVYFVWDIFFFPKLKSKHKQSQVLALLFLLLFAFHPVVWQPILYVSARSILIAALFILLTIREYGSERRSLWRLGLWALLAFGAKETGILALPLALIINREKRNQDWQVLKGNKKLLMGVVALAALSVALVLYGKRRLIFFFIKTIFNGANRPHNYLDYVLTEVSMVWSYIVRYFWSHTWQLLYAPAIQNHKNPMDWFFAGALVAVLTSIYFFLRRRAEVTHLYIAGLLSFLPEVFYPRNLFGQDQRCYLGFIFLTVLSWHVATGLNSQKISKWLKVFLVGIIVTNLLSVVQRISIYKSEMAIYKRSVIAQPHDILSAGNLSLIYRNMGEDDKSYNLLKQTLVSNITFSSQSTYLRNQLALIVRGLASHHLVKGEWRELEKLIKICHGEKMNRDICHFVEAKMLRAQGHYEKSMSVLGKIKTQERIPVQSEMALNFLAMGESKRAEQIAMELFEKYPKDTRTTFLVVNIYKQQNKSEEALKWLDAEVERLKKSNIDADILSSLQRLRSSLTTQ